MQRHILPINSETRLLLQMPKPGITGTVLRKAALPARARTLPDVDIHAGDKEPLAASNYESLGDGPKAQLECRSCLEKAVGVASFWDTRVAPQTKCFSDFVEGCLGLYKIYQNEEAHQLWSCW